MVGYLLGLLWAMACIIIRIRTLLLLFLPMKKVKLPSFRKGKGISLLIFKLKLGLGSINKMILLSRLAYTLF